jgi:aspartate aminotransferase
MSRFISRKVESDLRSASWIREMFERGRRMKAERGEAAVCDFSLGNPNGTPPPQFFEAVQAVAAERRPELHRYMPNAGFDETRAAVARFLSEEYGAAFDGPSVIITSGAAGGMNVTLRAICDPDDEIIVLAPYFPEYRFYIEQAGARLVVVQSNERFQPEPRRIEEALTPRTRGLILNSPNNPSGALLTPEACRGLVEALRRRDDPERPLYLLLDDPYRRLVFDAPRGPTPIGE